MTAGFQWDAFATVINSLDSVAKLRQLILKLAVEGKLVEQADGGEPVQRFLDRIWSEQRGRCRIPDSIQVPPFELPAHWRWVALAEVAEFSIGKTPPRGDPMYWGSEEHPWVSIADMEHYGTVSKTKERVSSQAASEIFRQRFVEEGSILLSFKLTIGKVSRAGIRCFHNEAIISLNPPETELRDYLFRFLPIFAKLQTSNNAIKGSTLNKGLLAHLPIALPPLAEQKRIVAKVDELMALCDRLEAQLKQRDEQASVLAKASVARFQADPTVENLEYLFHPGACQAPNASAVLKDVVLQLAVQGRLVAQDPTEGSGRQLLDRILAERGSKAGSVGGGPSGTGNRNTRDSPSLRLPPSWHETSLIEVVVEIQTGPFGSSLHKSDYQPGGTPVVNPASFRHGSIIPVAGMAVGDATARRLAAFKLNAGDILVARRGEMGRCAVVTTREAGWLCGTGSLVLRMPRAMHAPFLALVIGAPPARAYLTGASVGSTMQNLNQSILGKMPIGLPPFAEQVRIVAKVNELMALVDQLESQITASEAAGANLLDALVAELAPSN